MWITIDDLKEAFGEFDLPKTKINNVKEIDTEKINEAITWSENWFRGNFEAIGIDTSLFTETQTNEFKMYNLDVTRYFYSNKDMKNTDEIRARYENAKQWMKDVKEGKIKLITIEQPDPIENKGFVVMTIVRAS